MQDDQKIYWLFKLKRFRVGPLRVNKLISGWKTFIHFDPYSNRLSFVFAYFITDSLEIYKARKDLTSSGKSFQNIVSILHVSLFKTSVFKILKASRQSLPNEVTTKNVEWKVVSFANRNTLPEKILKFCGIFPIYEVEENEFPLEILNVSGRQISGKRTFNIICHLGWIWYICFWNLSQNFDSDVPRASLNLDLHKYSQNVSCFHQWLIVFRTQFF